MSTLPRALWPWSPWLEAWVPEATEALGPTLGRIEAWLGPGPRPEPATDGPPAGLDGLSRSGPYTRLLTSEWLLADEVPDEFLRRAADREHSFYRLARENPRPRKGIVVLLDAGPEQFGQPRALQLALLVVLARRASRAGCELRWGTLQAPARFLAVDEPAVRAFIQARSPKLPPPDAVTDADRDADELWLVGGDGVDAVQIGRSARQLRIAEEPGLDTLTLVMRERGRAEELRVPGLAHRAASRLLTDPFAGPTPVVPPPRDSAWKALPVGMSPVEHLSIVPGTLQLMTWHANGDVLARRLPTTDRASLGRWKRDASQDRARIALGWRDSQFVTVQTHAGMVWISAKNLGCRASLPAPMAPGRGPALQFGRNLWFADGAGELWHLDPDKQLRRAGASGVVLLFLDADEPRAIGRVADAWAILALGAEVRILGTFAGSQPWLTQFGPADGAWSLQTIVGDEVRRVGLQAWRDAGTVQPIGTTAATFPIRAAGEHLGGGLFHKPGSRLLHKVDGSLALELPRRPRLIVADPSGRLVALMSEEATLEVWDTRTRSPLALRHSR